MMIQLMRPDRLVQDAPLSDDLALVSELHVLTGAKSVEEAHRGMLEILGHAIPFSYAAILRENADKSNALQTAAATSDEQCLTILAGNPFFQKVLDGAAAIVPDLSGVAGWEEAGRQLATTARSALLMPFQTWQQSGLILCLHEEPSNFSPDHLHTLETFAPLAAHAMQRVEQIGELHELVDQLDFLAHHDALTDLPNRTLFRKRLSSALEASSRGEKGSVALLMIDLDHFKEINDFYGHPTGDEVLREIAFRLRRVSPRKAFVSRMSGDEFAMIVSDVTDIAETQTLLNDIYRRLEMPVLAGDQTIPAGLTIGVALGPRDGSRPDELVGNADLALYRAKRDHKGSYRFFDPGLDRVMVNRREIGSALRHAITAREFCNFYQPQYDLSTGDLVGYEALLRWNDPRQGIRMPGEFIPVAEETGLIGDLGEWALIQACIDAANWAEHLTVAVNLSPVQLKQGNIRQSVERALAQSGLRPERLEVEVTESILISDTERTVELLKALQRIGVGIAMDDFGTGYSSLSYLARFPFNKIKVDRSFVSNLGHDQHVDAIIATIMGLGRSFNVPITAEGIETEAQLEMLRSVGCQYGQGYLFGKPQPLEGLTAPDSIG